VISVNQNRSHKPDNGEDTDIAKRTVAVGFDILPNATLAV
jgi:hypothetical protein